MIRESRRAAVVFEADQGWVPVDSNGTVWRYRTRGSSGVVVFKREGEGQGAARSYEATHLDRFSRDETITTARRSKAVRFAVAGTTTRDEGERGLVERSGRSLERGQVGADRVAPGASAGAHSSPASERAPGDLNQESRNVEAAVPGQIYAADAYVVELRRGEYWVEVPGPNGLPAVTTDPTRASTFSSADMALLHGTFAAVPTARVLQIRITVTEV